MRTYSGEAVTAGVSVEALYNSQWLPLLRLAALLVDERAAAEDVVHDAFAGLHARAGRLDHPDRAVAYLRASVVNGSRSVLRRRRTARAWTPPRPDVQVSAEDSALLAEQRQEVLAAVRGLPARQREVLVLRYWADLSEKEIALAMGISSGTVKSTASRGLRALQQVLTAKEEH